MAWDYYAFLDVARDADLDTIKRAAARKRRELEIAKDSPGKALLNEATQVLRDPQARAEYDTLQQHGERFSALLTRARAASDAAAWPEAIRLYREALTVVPDHPLLRSSLAYALAEHDNFREAEKIYGELVKDYPDSAIYWANYGSVCLDLAKRMPTPPAAITGRADLMLTGVQSAKRMVALNKLAGILGGDLDSAKALVKTAPQPLLRAVEKSRAEELARGLRPAGVLVTVAPSTARAIICPHCYHTNYLPVELSGRKITCDFCRQDFSIYRGDREAMLQRGRSYLERAIALDPTNIQNYIEITSSFVTEEAYPQAEVWVERAIAADGREDIEDIGALTELCLLHARQGRQDALDSTIRRLRAVLPSQESEALREVTAAIGTMCLGELMEQHFDAAARLARAASTLIANTPALSEDAVALDGVAARAENLQQVTRELAVLTQDLQIIAPVIDIVRVLVAEQTMEMIESRTAAQLETAFDTLYNYARNVVRASVKRIKVKYPAIYQIIAPFFAQAFGEA